jgi:hypothetical protein
MLGLAVLTAIAAAPFTEQQQQHTAVDPWGNDAVRIRLYPRGAPTTPDDALGYLLPSPAGASPHHAATSSSNIKVAVSASTEFITVSRDDGEVLLTQTTPLTSGEPRPDGTMGINGSLAVLAGKPDLRFFGGGCRCGGGYTPEDGHGGGAMINTGDTSHGAADLHFGVPIGLAPGPTPGGIGSQCGAMNGMPWIVVGTPGTGLSFGIFVNTLGLTYGAWCSRGWTALSAASLCWWESRC